MHRVVAAVLVLGISCCLTGAMHAQSSNASLTGLVTDPSKAVIVGAKITTINEATNVRYEGATNSSGSYYVTGLPPGTYRVEVEKTGFKTVLKPSVILHVQDTIEVNFEMAVGSTTESVTVEGGAPLVNTQDASVSTVVDRRFVEDMPLNGRSIQSLITLTPGIVLTKVTFGTQDQFSVNGQRANANYLMIDGVSANIGISPSQNVGVSTSGTSAGFGTTGGSNNLVSIDALQEFRVLTSSFAPEFGRTPGGQISIVTRSGSNEFHGALFEYFRNDALDASDWFANQAGLPKAALRQNDFGGVLGGPILRNKTFFFFSYEGLRLRLPQTAITTVPSTLARSNAQPALQPFFNAYPIPNGANLPGNVAQFNTTFSDPSSLDSTSLRLDHRAGSRLNFFARYSYAPSDTDQRGAASGFALSTVQFLSDKTQTLTGGATLTISNRMATDFRANYSRNSGTIGEHLDSFGGAVPVADSLLYPSGVSGSDSEFTFCIAVLSPNCWAKAAFFGTDIQRQINLLDTVSMVAGTHQIKFGLDYRRLSPIIDREHYLQQPLFTSMSAAMVGQPTGFVSLLAFNGPRFPVFDNVSSFWQDTWKAASRLTLTYGVRWEINPTPHESNGNDPFAITGLDNPSTMSVAPIGTPLYKTSYRNFAPRLGVAYQLSQASGRETVLRAGFGIFYDLGTDQVATAFGFSSPYFRQRRLVGVPFPLSAAAAAPPPFSVNPPFGTLFGVIDPSLRLPYTYHWNISLERALGSNQRISTWYVGAAGRRLTRQEVLSAPNQNFIGTVDVTRNVATSDYHALQLQFQRRLLRGLQALASYAWSHSLDNVSSDTSFQAPLANIDFRRERGSSDFDVRQSFNTAVSYEIPGWAQNGFAAALLRNFSVDSVFTARSATPINVLTGSNAIGGINVGRPDLVAGQPLYISDPTVAGGRRINPSAFDALTPTAAKRQGSLGRNALRGFPAWQLDLTLRREFQLTDRLKLRFIVDAFNIFNHPNFADPGSPGVAAFTNAVNNPFFGRSTEMLGNGLGGGGASGGFNPLFQIGRPRSIQLGLKLLL